MAPGPRSRLSPNPDLPLSRPVDVESVPDTGLAIEITASETECAAIAAETELPAVGRLAASLVVERRRNGRCEVTGTLTARITQICVVSLEPFESDVEQEIAIVFAPPPPAATPPRHERASRRSAEIRPTHVPPPPASEDDPPDPIVDGVIDLGAVTVEFLTLARDLYPRKPGAAFTDVTVGEDEAPEPSAFAALQRFKDRS